jgi:hypothetical protein
VYLHSVPWPAEPMHASSTYCGCRAGNAFAVLCSSLLFLVSSARFGSSPTELFRLLIPAVQGPCMALSSCRCRQALGRDVERELDAAFAFAYLDRCHLHVFLTWHQSPSSVPENPKADYWKKKKKRNEPPGAAPSVSLTTLMLNLADLLISLQGKPAARSRWRRRILTAMWW